MSPRMASAVLLSLLSLIPSMALAQAGPAVELVDAAGRPAAFYLESSRVRVRVTSPYGPSGAVPVDVQSTLTGDVETVWADPTAPGVYEGTIVMRTGWSPQAGNGFLETTQDPGPPHRFDTVAATYTDPGGTATDSVGLIGSLTTFVDAYGRDAAAYATGSTGYIQVEDQNRNTPGVFDQVYVQVTSLATGDNEVLQLLEVAKDSGVFSGSIALQDSPSPASSDGRLQAQVGEEIEAQHTDVMGYVASGDRVRIDGASLGFIEADGSPAVEVLESGRARVRLFSLYDNQSPGQAESVTIEMRSLQTGDVEPVMMTETGPDTAVFEGSIVLSNAPVGPDGQLETRNSGSPDYTPDTVRASYGPIVATATVRGARIVFLDAFGRATASYAAGEAVRVRVIDHNVNNPEMRDSFPVELVSSQTSSSRLVQVNETGFDTGIFEGSQATVLGGGNPDALGVVPGGTVEAWHYQYNSPNRLMKTAEIRGSALLFVDAAGQPAAVYLESSRAYLRLFSAGANSNPTAQDSVQVQVVSELTGDIESVVLSETGPSTSVFTGSITLRMGFSAQPNNGFLENTRNQGPPIEADTLHAVYTDPDGTATAQAALIGSRTWFADAAGNPVSVYPVGGTAWLRVEDQNRNTPGVFDQVYVQVTSPGTGDNEMLALLEVSKDSGIFAGSLPLVTSGNPTPGDDRLHVIPGYPIKAEHTDVMGSTSSTAQALIEYASLEFIEADGEPTSELLESGTARVRLFSSQDNYNPGMAESVTVELRSLQAGDIEPVMLTETGPDTAVFEGSIELSNSPAGPNGQLETRNSGYPEYRSETVRAVYGYGGGVTATATVSGARIVFLDAYGQETTGYAAGETVRVRVIDHNRDNPQVLDSFPVELVSPQTSSSLLVPVNETGFDTGIFEGSQATVLGGGNPDALGVVPGGTVEAWHYPYNSPNRLMKTAAIRGSALLFVDAAGQPAAAYLESSRAYLRLFSAGANSNPTAPDSVQVQVTSELTGDLEFVVLSETGPSTSVFTGSIALRMGFAPQPNNGFLENTRNQGPPIEADTLHAVYANPDGTATAQAGLVGSRTWFADAAGNPVSAYPVGGTAWVRVEDQNRNTPGVFDQVYVQVTSPGTGDNELLALLEVSKDSGIFARSLPLVTSGNPTPGDNRLHVMPGYLVNAEHTDVMGSTSSTAQALIEYASLEFIEANGEPTSELLESGTARVRLFSTQDNYNPGQAESVTVELRSLHAGDIEPVTLTETGPDTAVFEGSIELSSGPAGPGGQLETRNSGYPEYRPETVRASYGYGGGITATATVSSARIMFLDAYGRETGSYAAGETVRVRVIDHNRNTPQVRETVEVELVSPQTSSSRLVQMNETGFDTGVFEGSQATVLGGGNPNALGVVPGGTVEAWHYQYNSPNRLMKTASIRGSALLFVDAAGQPAAVYLESSRAYLRLFSAGANSNPTAPDSVQVQVGSELTGDVEFVILTETGPSTSVFAGSIALRLGFSPQPNNGFLENTRNQGPPIEADTLHAVYNDPDGTSTAQAGLIGSRTWFADAAGNPVSVYPVGGTAWVRVEDQNRNTPGVFDQVYVQVASPGTGDNEMLALLEVSKDSGIFAGSLPLVTSGSSTPGDDRLHVMPGYLIDAEHTDVMGSTSSRAQALIDYASLEFIEADGEPTSELLESGTARVRLFSAQDNYNPGQAESVSVELRSLHAGDVEPVTLTETGPSTGIFEGSIELSNDPAGPNGQLETRNSGFPEYRPETVRAIYGYGGGITAAATVSSARIVFLNAHGRETAGYAAGETVRVRVIDHNRNTPQVRETVEVELVSPETSSSRLVQMNETGFDTGIFEGSQATVLGGGNPDALGVVPGGTVEAWYYQYNSPNRLLKTASIRGNALLFVDAAGQPAAVYLESSRAYLRLFSAGANDNPTAPDSVQVQVTSELTGDLEFVTLSETGPSTSVFTGSIALRMGFSPQPNNGFLENTRIPGPPIEADTLHAAYNDPDGTATAQAGLIGSRTWFADAAGNPVSVYPVGGTAWVRVEDQNRNTPGVFDQVYVQVTSPGTGDNEMLALLEVSKDSGIFAGSLPLVTSGNPTPGDNRLHVMPGYPIDAEHTDVMGSTSSRAQALVDYASLEFIEADGEPTSELLESGTARVRLFSAQDNYNPGVAESVTVELRSVQAGDVEPVMLTETGLSTGIFEGSIELSNGPAGPDGQLETRTSGFPEYRPETVRAIYGYGGGITATATVSGARIVFLDAYGQETASYAAGETMWVRVIDHNRNNPQSRDTFEVELVSPQTSSSRLVQMNETGFDTGIFEGSQATVLGGGNPDALGVAPGGTVEAWHYQYNSPNRLMKTASIRGNALLFVDAAGQPAAAYLESSRAWLRLASAGADDNPTVPDSVSVQVASELTGDVESVILTETGPSTAVFTGSIALRLGFSPQPNNGFLENTRNQGPPIEADTLHATYTDPDGIATAQAGLIGSRTWFVDAAGNPASVYPVGGTAHLRVEDQNRNTPGVIDQVYVEVTSPATGDNEMLQLQEVGPDAGVFAGSLPLATAGNPTPGDNRLHAMPGYLIEAEHLDVMGFTSSTAEALIDYASIEFVAADGQTTRELLENGTARVRVFSTPANQNPGQADAVTVEMRSLYAGDVEILTLTETGPSTGLFEGSIELAFGPASLNGQLETRNSGFPEYRPDEVRARYSPTIGVTATVAGSRVSFLNLRGQVTTTYALGSTVRVRVQDQNWNNPAQVDLVYVQVQALGNGDPEILQLTETGVDTGVFAGSLPSAPASSAPGDGTLSAFAGEQVEVAHQNYNSPISNIVRANFGSNLAPQLADDTAETVQDQAVTVAVLANDTSASPLSVASVTQGAHGTVTIHPDGTLQYTPAAGYTGPDTFTYLAVDAEGGEGQATVTVTVIPANRPPQANYDQATRPEDQAVIIAVLANDNDPDDDPLQVVSVTQPASGGAVAINGDNTVTFTPAPNFFGEGVTFTYVIRDPAGATSSSGVTVNVTPVNDPPVANDDAAETTEDQAVIIPVQANDTDIDSATFYPVSATQPANGSVVVSSAEGTATYTPNLNFHGTDTFVYTLQDDAGATDTATVTVTVSAANDAPVAIDDTATAEEDGSASVAVLANDTDGDNDSLNVTAVTQGTNGAVTINPDKTVTYTPNANFNGSDSFTYTIGDGNGGTATASVNVTVTPVNDSPVANADAATTPEDTAVTVTVLANDTDLDGHSLSVTNVTQGASGSVVINPNGTVTYTPNANFNGNDAFTYTASDGNGGTATASVSITVTPVNDAPVAVNDSASTVAETAVTVSVLANDFDLDGPSLSIASATQGSSGIVTVNANQTITYTPSPEFKGSDSFTYTVTDGAGGTATATVTVAVVAPPRIATSLQVLYDFAEGSGSVVHDVSGVGTPLDLTVASPAAVSWLPGALSVDSATVIQSAGNATKVITACQASNAITIEAWVLPANVTQTGPAHIVTLSQAFNKRDFTLGQSGSRYEGMLRTTGTNQAGTSLLFGTGTATVELTHVVFTRDSSGNSRAYVNGTLSTSATITGNFSSWVSYKLGVANELSGSRPWVGDLHLVAVYSQALTGAEVRQNYLAGAD